MFYRCCCANIVTDYIARIFWLATKENYSTDNKAERQTKETTMPRKIGRVWEEVMRRKMIEVLDI